MAREEPLTGGEEHEGRTRGMPTSANVSSPGTVVGDGAIARQIGPVMLAAALGLIPFTVFSTFLVDIASSTGREPVAVGSLRGLGGLSAMFVGALYVPLADRVRTGLASASALVLLALGAGLLLISDLWAIVAFCLVIGAATAVLNPALQAEAASRFSRVAEQGRAATMVTATTTLTAALAGPVLGGLSLLGGWQGILALTAALAVLTATCIVRRPPAPEGRARARSRRSGGWTEGREDPTPPMVASGDRRSGGHLSDWSRLLRRADLLSLIGISAFRTAAFMGSLAVVAAVYAERHSITGTTFTVVWTVSGVSFFAANWWSGRRLAQETGIGTLTVAGLVAALAGVILVFAVVPLPMMIIGTGLLAVGHAMIAASVTTLIVRRAGELRGRALAMAGTGQSVGTFAGAWAAGAGFAVGGWPGCAAALAILTVVAGFLMVPALRRRENSPNL